MTDFSNQIATGNAKPVIFTPTPELCDGCGTRFSKFAYTVMYDAATGGPTGPWGCLCETCFQFGPGIGNLGAGLGQKYMRASDGLFRGIEGFGK